MVTSPRGLRPSEPTRIGEYRISALLGEGGQGTVYLGLAPNGTKVAIKVLLPQFASDPRTCRRFLREAEVAASVAAFCTAKIVATGLYGARPYIVSEYVPGPSLDTKVKTDGPRTGSGLERLAVSTLTALASIHAAGVVHRDFKPGNVILGPEGPVVIDFGIARALDTMTSTTRVVGTPAYMAPEQLTDSPVTAACDVFSWGSTMAFAATGRPAFSGSTVPAILHAIIYTEPDLAGVPKPLRELVAAALAKDPDARPSAADLLAWLTSGRVPPSVALSGAAAGAGKPLVWGALTEAPTRTPPPQGAEDTPVPVKTSGRNRTDERTTWPSGPGAHRKPLRRPRIAVIAGSVAVTAVAGMLVVPSWFDIGMEIAAGARTVPAAANPPQQTTPAATGQIPPQIPTQTPARTPGPASGQGLDLSQYPRLDLDERFTDPEDVKQYTSHQPEENEVVPSIATENGVFSATGATPYFTMVSGPSLLPADRAISMVTVGSFVTTPQREDSVYVGWVKDGNNYVSAWYNNSRKTSGLNVRLNGQLRESPATPLELREGNRFALVLDRDTITSYVESGGTWRKLQGARIGDLFSGSVNRKDYRYGFGLRASQGTITITSAEGRSAL